MSLFRRLFVFLRYPVLLIGVAALALTRVSAQAQDNDWSTPIQLSGLGQSSWFPEIAADATGRLHAFWATSLSVQGAVYDSLMYATSLDGTQWSESVDVIASRQPPGEVPRPDVWIDRYGELQMSFRHANMFYTHARLDPVRGAVSWAPRVQLAGFGYFSRILLDPQDRIYVVMTVNIPVPGCSACFPLYFARSDDYGASWTDPVAVAQLPTGAAKPSFLMDSKGTLHLVWESGRGGSFGRVPSPAQLLYASSTNRGETWSTPLEIKVPETAGSVHAAIVTDKQGQLMIVSGTVPVRPEDSSTQEFVAGNLFYVLSADGGATWSEPALIPDAVIDDSRAQDNISVAVDSQGDVHLIANLYFVSSVRNLPVSNYVVSHFVWDGSKWSAPEPIVTYQGDTPEWPALTVARGNQLHVAWFVRDADHVFDPDNGDYRVWYARRMLAVPAIPPQSYPTRAPRLTPTAASTAISTGPALTPTPTLPALTPGAPRRDYREQDYLLVAAQSLLPVLALVVIAVVVARLRRR